MGLEEIAGKNLAINDVASSKKDLRRKESIRSPHNFTCGFFRLHDAYDGLLALRTLSNKKKNATHTTFGIFNHTYEIYY